jgi:hypothetical protein
VGAPGQLRSASLLPCIVRAQVWGCCWERRYLGSLGCSGGLLLLRGCMDACSDLSEKMGGYM